MNNILILNNKDIGVSDIEFDIDGTIRIIDKDHKYSLLVWIRYNKDDIDSLKINEKKDISFNEYTISEYHESAIVWPIISQVERVKENLISFYFKFDNIENDVCYMNERGCFDIKLHSLECKTYVNYKKGGIMKYIIPTLETDRLILKKGNLDDYKKVYEYDFTRLRNIDGEFEYVKLDPEKINGFETYADEENNVLDFIIYLKENNEPIGNITYDRYDEKQKSLEISINIHPDYWKCGYATEAIVSSMKYVFDTLNINKIFYGYAVDNYKSKGLSDKVGFKYFGKHITHYIRLDKDIPEIDTVMNKYMFEKLYKK